MNLSLTNLIPNYSINDVSGELVQSEDFLRTEHRFLICLLGNVTHHGLLRLVPVTSVHQNLPIDKFVIVSEQVFLLMVVMSRLVLAE